MKKTFILIQYLFLLLCYHQLPAQDCFCTVGLTSFTATVQTSSVLIKWTSEGETSTGKSYNIEKSYNDASHFFLIGTVNYQYPAGGSTRNYSFTDACSKPGITPPPTKFYYRLTSLGIDGTVKNSIVINSTIPASAGTCYTTCQSSTGGISGPAYICSSSTGQYTVGFTSTPVTWSISSTPDATLTVGPVANYASITTNSNVLNGSATLTATLTGCATPFTKTILLGTQNSLTGTYTTSKGTNPLQTVNFGVPIGNVSAYFQWPNVSNISVTCTDPSFTINGNTFSFTIGANQNINVNFSGTTSCGNVTATRTFVQSGSFAVTVSPNPAKNLVSVSIKDLKNTKALATNDVKTVKGKSFTNMFLYNLNTQVLVREWAYPDTQSNNYNLNIADIKSGIYILKIERNNETTSTKIIVE